MFGFTIGSLRLFLKPSGSSSNNLLWSKTGNQANMWKVAQVTVRRSTQSFKVTLTLVIISSNRSLRVAPSVKDKRDVYAVATKSLLQKRK